MKKFTLNIIILTYRSDLIAKTNIRIAVETTSQHPEARLIIGYGGNDENHRKWLNDLKFELTDKKSIELINEISIQKRMELALKFPSEWTLFISDDDLITSNYLSAFLKEIHNSDESISNIFPRHYGVNNDSETSFMQFNQITDHHAIDRIKNYISSSHSGIRYYSAHRTHNIKDIYDQKIASNFFPSYLDQLITLSSIANGKSISCSEPNTLIYNFENWSTADSCIISDAKFYNNKKMIYFHDIFWMSDYAEIIKPYFSSNIDQQWLISYCLKKLKDSLANFMRKIKLIPIETSEAKLILEKINEMHEEISNCKNSNDLAMVNKKYINSIMQEF